MTANWGKLLALDLYECAVNRLADPAGLKNFMNDLVKVVDMVAHGECYIDRFGIGDLQGYSAMQFIETSSITIHIDEKGNRVFIDIFSCKDFDVQKAEKFSQKYFGAKTTKSTILLR